MFTVKLIRGEPLGDKLWTHPTGASARRRAYALAELHSTEPKNVDGVYTIDATQYYAKQNERLKNGNS